MATADFIASSVLLGIMWLVMTIVIACSNIGAGLLYMIFSGLWTAWTLWIQWCVRSGGCTALAWILVAMYALQFIVVGVSLAVVGSIKSKSDDDDRERRHRHRD